MADTWWNMLNKVNTAAQAAAERIPWQDIRTRHLNNRPTKVVKVLSVPFGNSKYTVKYHIGTNGTIYQYVSIEPQGDDLDSPEGVTLQRTNLHSFNMETLQALLSALEATYPIE